MRTQQLEQRAWTALRRPGLLHVLGVDEVGYGSFAGPVVVAAVVVRAGWSDPRVRDSKKVRPRARREELAEGVLSSDVVLTCRVLENDSEVIDRIGLGRARDDLVRRAVALCLADYPDAQVVMDGNVLPKGLPPGAVCLPKADALVPAVSAASLIAKNYRDKLMEVYHQRYPGYGFDENAGYNSPVHEAALKRLGPCPIHRMSFSNLKKYKQKTSP